MANPDAESSAPWFLALACGAWIALSVLFQGLYVASQVVRSQDQGSRPTDFTVFWVAGSLAAEGTPAKAYDLEVLKARTLERVSPTMKKHNHFAYPPPSLFLLRPLGSLEHDTAQALFLGLSLGLYFWGLWVWAGPKAALFLTLGFWGVTANLSFGQNGMFTAGVFFLAAAALEKAPFWAGVLFGILSYKPQLAFLPPLFYGWHKNRSVLGGFLLAAGGAYLASWFLLGPKTWSAYLALTPKHFAWLNSERVPLPFIPTVWSSLRLLKLPGLLAKAASIGVALFGLVFVHRLWLEEDDSAQRVSSLALLLCLVAPKLGNYDLVILGLPLALWIRDRAPWRLPTSSCLLFCLVYALPVLGEKLAFWSRDLVGLGWMISPWVILALLLGAKKKPPAGVEGIRRGEG